MNILFISLLSHQLFFITKRGRRETMEQNCQPIAHRTRRRYKEKQINCQTTSSSTKEPENTVVLDTTVVNYHVEYMRGRFSYNVLFKYSEGTFKLYELLENERMTEEMKYLILSEMVKCPCLIVGHRDFVEKIIGIILGDVSSTTQTISFIPILLDALIGFDKSVNIFSNPNDLLKYIEDRDTLTEMTIQKIVNNNDVLLSQQQNDEMMLQYFIQFINEYLC